MEGGGGGVHLASEILRVKRSSFIKTLHTCGGVAVTDLPTSREPETLLENKKTRDDGQEESRKTTAAPECSA